MTIVIYSDGSCLKNPGPGAYCGAIFFEDKVLILSDFFPNTTNNQMELMGAIKSLEYLSGRELFSDQIEINTDSQYVKNGIESWIFNWKQNNWKTANRQPVKNKELWEKLYYYNNLIKPKWNWVKGHSTNLYNEMVDFIANDTSNKSRPYNVNDIEILERKFNCKTMNHRKIMIV